MASATLIVDPTVVTMMLLVTTVASGTVSATFA